MHTDPELLSLVALGEDVGEEDERAHARTCPECAAELVELRRVVALGRSLRGEPALDTPREEVWALIRDELERRPVREPGSESSLLLPTDSPQPLAVVRSRPGDHRLRAHARLSPVERSWSRASGRAELATDEHGRRLLRVALDADLPSSGVRQAWLVHRDHPELRQTLGILDGPHGLWTVEHSIDLEEYAILDISQQGTGQTEHSGDTIVRGEFTLVV